MTLMACTRTQSEKNSHLSETQQVDSIRDLEGVEADLAVLSTQVSKLVDSSLRIAEELRYLQASLEV